MIYPILELIAQNVLTTVQGVTVANGYNFTLDAHRHTRDGDKQAHLEAVITQLDDEPVEPGVYNTLEFNTPFGVGVYVIPATGDPTPIDQYCNLIAADIQKAMMVDRYRGGYAMETHVIPPQRGKVNSQKDALQYDLIVVAFNVNYRVRDIDPYVNAK
jgi:hypothetical protein